MPQALAVFTQSSRNLVRYRVTMGSNWIGGWNASNLMAMYSLANATSGSGAKLVAVLCGPVPGAPSCGNGSAGSDLVNGTLTQASIVDGSPISFTALAKLMGGYYQSWAAKQGQGSDGAWASPDQASRVPGIQVLAQTPIAAGQKRSSSVFSGAVVPANAAALPQDPVPYATGMRLDSAMPYHAFLWPLPDSDSTAAGSISIAMYNDSALAYTVVVRRLPRNDSITSVTMESLNPRLMGSALAFPKGYFAYTQKGCCGGQAPNFFSSFPSGVQAPQDGAEFMVASGEWPPPTGTSQRDRFVAAMLADLQAEDYLVGVRVRTKNSPAGLLLGEIVLGCGPDDLGLPPSAACDSSISGNRRRR
ncbi:hypothetical protein COCSUDRAFT_65629 [Coccomyxa subellipsoidea C-169]|uniref:Uncharacterized protein n=1 Tax=Coccomyxa subellipsoidea (strain C-169) TaxID=574566 RepID=I0YZP6_COCSC|nr:hypothetical protein COCSUDRAFT_65629 [Coccomyxa subellipsoidea C-169]EIE23865.1 hypothetical protein COCSUDRAFT_65629 [Coccomyxa subellipsoidea C-169]|eukprot:XP_005648409.1 hypothetical protein COCSUDRAFT_65629 [Coccomyxa subellipsoidea C-169]